MIIVAVQMRSPPRSIATVRTTKRSLARVNRHVFLKITPITRFVRTRVAREGFFPAVCPHVTRSVAPAALIVTQGTLKYLVVVLACIEPRVNHGYVSVQIRFL